MTPGVVGRFTRRTAHRVFHLRGVSAIVQLESLRLHVGGELGAQRIGEGVGVDGGSDGVADCTAETVEEAQDREHHGDAFAVRRGHDGHVRADDQRAAAEGDEDLAHDHVADVAVVACTTEMDHEARAEDKEGQAEEETGVFEVFGETDPDTEDDAPEARADVVDLAHVAGHRDREVVHHQAEVVEVQVPAVEAEVGDCRETAGAQHGAFFEEVVADEVHAGTPFLPSSEDEEQAEADNHHGDEASGFVLCAAVLLKTKREEQKNPCGHQEASTNDCTVRIILKITRKMIKRLTIKFMDIVNDGLKHRPTTGFPLVKTHLLCLSLVELEDNSQRSKDERLDNGKRAIRPPPGAHLQERLTSQWTRKRRTDKRRTGKSKCKSPIPQPGRISHENLQNEIDGVVADPVQDVSGSVGVGAVAGGQDYQAQDVDADEDEIALGTTPDVDCFGNGQFDHTADDTVQDVGGTDLGGGCKAAVGLVDDIAADGGLQSQREETHPNPVIVSLRVSELARTRRAHQA